MADEYGYVLDCESNQFNYDVITKKFKLFVDKYDARKYDIIHVHDTRTMLTIFAFFFSKIYNIPLILQPHGTLKSNYTGKFI